MTACQIEKPKFVLSVFVKSEVPGIDSKQRTGQILTLYQYNGLSKLTRFFKLPKMIDPSNLILCLLRAERDLV